MNPTAAWRAWAMRAPDIEPDRSMTSATAIEGRDRAIDPVAALTSTTRNVWPSEPWST